MNNVYQLMRRGAESITLSKYEQNDFPIYYSLVKEDNVMRYVSGKGLTVEEAGKKFASIMAINTENAEIGYFKIYNVAGDFIGDGKIEWNKHDNTKLEIGYILKEVFWGKGYGTMICSKLLSQIDEIFPTVDIVGIFDPENRASKKLLEKFGFKRYFLGVEDDLPTEKLILSKSK
jgi:ribosomal-protein-alanine N-acetyltransferase